jgi:hypothetical protein
MGSTENLNTPDQKSASPTVSKTEFFLSRKTRSSRSNNILFTINWRFKSAQKTLSATQIKQKYFTKNCVRVLLEIKPVMLPFFTFFEVDKERHTLKPYMAPVNHNIINETTWLKIVHTLMGNFCQDSDDTKGTVAMEDMGNDACVLVGCHENISNVSNRNMFERRSNFLL